MANCSCRATRALIESYVRLETRFDAADKAKGADAERYRREASA